MTMMQYLSAFRVYSMDALILALAVTLCTSLLKKTVLKKCPKKVYVFLPFVLGFLFYAAYRAILTKSAEPFTSGLTQTFEGGFACGCAATLYYVVYEQFFRTATTSAAEPPKADEYYLLAPILKGIVAEEKQEEAAKALIKGGKENTGDDLTRFCLETLRAYAVNGGEETPLTEGELFLYAKTVSAFLSNHTV